MDFVQAQIHETHLKRQTKNIIIRFQDNSSVKFGINGFWIKHRKMPIVFTNLHKDSLSIQNCYGDIAMVQKIMEKAERFSGKKGPDLTQCFSVHFKSYKKALKYIQDLAKEPLVMKTYFEPIIVLPQESTNISNSPDFSYGQFYLESETTRGSLGIRDFWEKYNIYGEDIKVVDIEYAMNIYHEELPTAINALSWSGCTENDDNHTYIHHGTASLGMVIASHNGYGIDGIAPKVTPIFCSQNNALDSSVGGTIFASLQHLNAGDVILLEAQTIAFHGGEGRYVPIEYSQETYDMILTATNMGIVIVEPAGNGDDNLDDSIYGNMFDRNERDSGAILVCASNPPSGNNGPSGEAMYYTNYGSRCDAHTVGYELYTTGYGDLYMGMNREYTSEFAGTSGASPQVVGAVALLQSFAKSKVKYISPKNMRQLLYDTGLSNVGENYIGNSIRMLEAAENIEDYWEPIKCDNSFNCPLGYLCKNREICVECLKDSDCSNDYLCSEDVCKIKPKIPSEASSETQFDKDSCMFFNSSRKMPIILVIAIIFVFRKRLFCNQYPSRDV